MSLWTSYRRVESWYSAIFWYRREQDVESDPEIRKQVQRMSNQTMASGKEQDPGWIPQESIYSLLGIERRWDCRLTFGKHPVGNISSLLLPILLIAGLHYTFSHLKGSHTGENLARETLAVLKLFNLECKLVSITDNNASNYPTLCR